MAINEFRKKLSRYDLGSVVKSAHQDENQALRVFNANSSVPASYSRVDLTYNAQGSVTTAVFYGGSLPQIRTVEFSNASAALNNEYWTIFAENNEAEYYIWYNVDGAGVDPAVSGAQGIEVSVNSTDSAAIVLLATQLALKAKCDFHIEKLSETKLKIFNVRNGGADLSVSTTSLIEVDNTQLGGEQLVKRIDIPFDGNARYLYNIQEREFKVESIASLGTVAVEVDAADGDNIAISAHENKRNITVENNYIAANLDVNNYTEILSYTATENLKLRVLKIKADTFGVFRVKVDGTIKDYFLTSPLERNCYFKFLEEEELNNASELTIEFVPERLDLSSYNFFYRIEAYA